MKLYFSNAMGTHQMCLCDGLEETLKVTHASLLLWGWLVMMIQSSRLECPKMAKPLYFLGVLKNHRKISR